MSPASASVAVTVVTAVLPATTYTVAVSPPPLEVIIGALSLVFVTVTEISCVSLAPWLSVTVTWTS